MMKQLLILMITWHTIRKTTSLPMKRKNQSKKETTNQESPNNSGIEKDNIKENAKRTCQLATKSNLITHKICLSSNNLDTIT